MQESTRRAQVCANSAHPHSDTIKNAIKKFNEAAAIRAGACSPQNNSAQFAFCVVRQKVPQAGLASLSSFEAKLFG
jgi:hypothetical protein